MQVAVVGRVSRIKGIHLVIEAFAIAKRAVPHLELLLVGDVRGEPDRAYRQELRERVNSLGLNDAVNFAGPVPYADLPRLLQKISVVVSVSNTTSLDKSLLEAMACGALPLGTKQFERIFLGELKERCSISDDPRDIAEKIVGMMQLTAAESARLRMQARSIVEQSFGLSRLIDTIATSMRRSAQGGLRHSDHRA
jgi:glycosyltransferase involved in cell wall biosynthesis